MKWVVLAALIALVPLLASWLRDNKARAPIVWTIMGAMPFLVGPWHLNASPISWALWPGYARGMEITALDAVALAVVLSGYPKRVKLPVRWPMIIYFVAVVAAIPHAAQPMAGFFYAWQLLRMALVIAATARIASEERGSDALLTGMVLGLTIQAGYAVFARSEGAVQTGGSLGHQNLLGFVSHMVIMPAFALLLAGKRTKLAVWGVAIGTIVVVLTASRATIAFSVAGFAITYLLSIARRWIPRKAAVGLFALVAVGLAFPFAKQSLERRFEAQGTTLTKVSNEDDERKAFERAAKMMIADHPLGVGPNMYVQVANLQGYSDRAGVIWAYTSRSAHVHNTYLLVTAETGYPGLIAFDMLLLFTLFITIFTAFTNRSDPKGEILIGISGALIAIYLHSLYEWIFVTQSAQYMFSIDVGMACGLIHQISAPRRENRVALAKPREPLVGVPLVKQARGDQDAASFRGV